MKVPIPRRKAARSSIKQPEDMADIFHAILKAEPEYDRDKEHFWIVGLSTRNNVKYIDLVSLGILNATLVHCREVFRFAIIQGTSSIMVVHNHPSGDPEPSEDDLCLTTRLVEAGRIIGIEVLDHIIIANDTQHWVSLKTRRIF
jgi:DNA repair protein RadC